MPSKKRIVLISIVISAAILGALGVWANNEVQKEVVSEVLVLNPAGDKGTAFVVYHPGITDFQEKVTIAFAEGLVANGWRVEITTASSQVPTDLSNYDLLALGTPTYGGPSQPILRYVDRLGDLEGTSTVIIITAAGNSEPAESGMKNRIQESNGSVVMVLAFYSIASNEEQYGTSDPEEIAYQAGVEIPLP